jgi:Uma2 family endonuclease
LVVEVVSPDDETWEKFDFYGRHGVEEIGVADPNERLLRWFDLAGERYEETDTSRMLEITTAELSSRIDWPG